MTDKEIKNSFNRFMKKNPTPWDWSEETFGMLCAYAGLVTHVLFQAKSVPKVHLERALKILTYMLDPEWCKWDNIYGEKKEKLAAIKIEKKAIEKAIKNNGKGEEYHVKGLLEQVAERFSES